MNDTARSAWEKLGNPLTNERGSKYRFRARHMVPLYRKLVKLYGDGDAPVHEQNLSIANAENIRRHMLRVYADYQVNNAHLRVLEDYKNNVQNDGKPRMDFGRREIVPNKEYDALEDAFGNDTPRDQDWLNNIKGAPETPKVVFTGLDDPAPAKDNAETSRADYVTRPEFAAQIEDIRHVIKSNSAYAVSFKREQEEINAAIASEVAKNTERIISLENSKPLTINLAQPSGDVIPLPGVHHNQFPKLLRALQAKLPDQHGFNIWLPGPAGTGKTTAAANAAKALGLEFHTNGKTYNDFDVLGHMHGKDYISKPFRKAFEHGGLYLADEIDGWSPDALLSLNSALANDFCTFPDGLVKRHKDFRFIGAANTFGMGATFEYVARFKPDAATMNRFIFVNWPLDEALEDAITTRKDWLAYVRGVRANAATYKIKAHLITPRQSVFGSTLLNAGFSFEEVCEMTLKCGVSETDWRQLTNNVYWNSNDTQPRRSNGY